LTVCCCEPAKLVKKKQKKQENASEVWKKTKRKPNFKLMKTLQS
jgi:Zn-dependent M32 family carboxypeptidase